MRRWRLEWILLAAILVPCAALALLGWRSLDGESKRARADFRERAGGAVDAARDALESVLASVAQGGAGMLALRADADGVLLVPRLTRGEASAEIVPRDPALLRFLEAEIDRFERDGEVGRAALRLDEVAARGDDPWLAAWALTARAAIERRADRLDQARESWRELASDFPEVRDERGLLRSLAGRLATLELDGFPPEELLELYSDAVADHVSFDDRATRMFKERVRDLLGADPSNARLSELVRLDAERARARRFGALWRMGVSDWVARGAPGGAAGFDGPPDPLDATKDTGRVIVAIASQANETIGGAIELEALARTALGQPEIEAYSALGFGTTVIDGSGKVLASAGGAASAMGGEPLARRELAGALGDCSVLAYGLDMGGFVARERRSFLWVLGSIILAVLVSVGAALATLRAVGREVEAARGREAFVAAVTHELKAPLASIRLLAEVLGDGNVAEDKVREFGRRTVAEADRLSRLISGVLELARIEHGGDASAAREKVDLAVVAHAARETFEPLAQERGFSLDLRASTPAFVRADRETLEGAVLNLLDNALKYSEMPGVIEIEVGHAKDKATIGVLDRGRGVPAGQADAIFEPFRRIGDELTRDRPGVGLGLALVHRIAEAHGGRACYYPRAGGGSRFEIELPAAPEADK